MATYFAASAIRALIGFGSLGGRFRCFRFFFRMRVFFTQRAGDRAGNRQRPRIDSSRNATRRQRSENGFRGNVADQEIPSERATAQSSQRAVETSATSFVSSKDFFAGRFRPAVQMNSQLHSSDNALNATIEFGDVVGGSGSNRIGQRNGPHADVLEPHQSILNNFT